MAETHFIRTPGPRFSARARLTQIRDTLKGGRFGLSLHGMLFCLMMLVALVPITAFYTWVGRAAYQRELASVHDAHLIIAKNLSDALNRYAMDAKTVFDLAVTNAIDVGDNGSFKRALASFHICHIRVLGPDNTVLSNIEGDTSHAPDLPKPELLAELRTTAEAANGDIVISGIRHHQGHPHFFILQALGQGRIALAPLSPDYVVRLQKSIAFGELGHSMMVDQDGLVLAHPNAEWQRISKNASKLSVVQAMISGETGVMQFYSPPMKADMIAGYTYVPETGWGVMVPQPISELAQRAARMQSGALVVALVQLALGVFLSWKFAGWLSRPIRSVSLAAQVLSRGDLRTRVGTLPRSAPAELVQTAQAFDVMADGIEQTTGRLQFALAEAEMISDERARLLGAAQAANAAKSQFVSMVSHELRTPLTSIKGALELLQVQTAQTLDSGAEKMLDVAIRNGKRLATMIDDLLDLEKLDAGQMEFRLDPTDLGALVAEGVEANRGYSAVTGVTFRYTSPAEQVLVNLDPGRMQQVLANLLSNAAKFSEAGQVVEVSVVVEDDRAKIHVRDEGTGIPDSVGDRIFEAFVQADSSDTRVVGGSGLGLSIARTIVQRHQGTLSYASEPGRGTVFTVDLPLLGEGKG
ncbi:MAG: ATP-binding protein [Paracoccaceae bacterium]